MNFLFAWSQRALAFHCYPTHVPYSLFLRLQSKDRNSGEMSISNLGFGAFWSIEATCSILSSQHLPLSIQQDDKRQVVAVAVSVCGCAYVCTGKLQKGGEKAESFHPFSSVKRKSCRFCWASPNLTPWELWAARANVCGFNTELKGTCLQGWCPSYSLSLVHTFPITMTPHGKVLRWVPQVWGKWTEQWLTFYRVHHREGHGMGIRTWRSTRQVQLHKG